LFEAGFFFSDVIKTALMCHRIDRDTGADKHGCTQSADENAVRCRFDKVLFSIHSRLPGRSLFLHPDHKGLGHMGVVWLHSTFHHLFHQTPLLAASGNHQQEYTKPGIFFSSAISKIE
jgi:hypothetical protein